jgi:hypothetical protein
MRIHSANLLQHLSDEEISFWAFSQVHSSADLLLHSFDEERNVFFSSFSL